MSASDPRPKGIRTCRKCRTPKPVAEFDGPARHCTECVEFRPPATTATQRNRARNRAYQRLAERHREEFTALYQAEITLMLAENGIAQLLGH